MRQPMIVGVDGRPTSQRAADAAATLASLLGAPLHVVCAYTDDPDKLIPSGENKWMVSTEENARRICEGVADAVEYSGPKIHVEVIQGKPADALVSYAQEVGAEILVVGNQGMHGARRILGSVANSVSHNATCDVYIVNTHST